MRAKPFVAAALAVMLGIGAAPAWAQAASFSALTQGVAQVCPSIINKLLENPMVADATRARPVSVPSVCRCAQARLVADKRLEQYLAVDPAVVQRRMSETAPRQYFALRLMEGVFACLAPELDAALAATHLPE